MNKTWAPALLLASLLTACGGSGGDTASPGAPLAARLAQGAQHAPAMPHAPAEYTQLVQSIYIGFFGRPADAPGLAFWNEKFSSLNLPLTAPELIAVYSNNAQARAMLDAFASSAEFGELYVNNLASFINALYLNGFNRDAEAGGLLFWAGLLGSRQITPALAVLHIVSDAQNADAIVVNKKIQAATLFTSLLDTAEKVHAYDGARINSSARAFLSTITAQTDMAALRLDIEGFVIAMTESSSPYLVESYYAGYNYLQDVTGNAPLYAAKYRYAFAALGSPLVAGSLIFGLPGQAVAFSGRAGDFTYGAPVAATASLGAQLLPEVAMLCQNVAINGGSAVRSTDVLVSRSTFQLLDAAALANQSFTFYREDCAVGGANSQTLSFDAQGNGRFPLASGVQALDAATVTRLLNGQVLTDPVTGKFLAFSAYRYSIGDGFKYVIVQHQGNRQTGVTDGVLATWSQE
ncbi:hypothetical protein FHW58_005475 [Duganella sp. 1224]|uniref:DUF4214 domain-containing protein n=1 Tax=Duganella sp. 1224 TaxID=2587052 RepID=UPI0015C710EE|nr:DUF4214 domain-containing protein [Duganella sp. 1224]NYE64237.1 hypothetical protein [Duganella sp. 1224]